MVYANATTPPPHIIYHLYARFIRAARAGPSARGRIESGGGNDERFAGGGSHWPDVVRTGSAAIHTCTRVGACAFKLDADR